MPYEMKSELPDRVSDNLPSKAQEIFKEAYNSAWKEYENPEDRRGNESRETTANKVAWSAVKKKYTKDSSGDWVKKDDN